MKPITISQKLKDKKISAEKMSRHEFLTKFTSTIPISDDMIDGYIINIDLDESVHWVSESVFKALFND